MGYDVHITRAEDWADNKGSEIAAEEWLALVASDPELIPEPINGKYFVIWRGCVNYPETWFNWYAGNVSTKYPDKATLRKMLQMAKKLNARVQGDESEIYDEQSIEDMPNEIFVQRRSQS